MMQRHNQMKLLTHRMLMPSIVEDVTIDAKEFKNLQCGTSHFIQVEAGSLGYIDYKCSGRITFERVAFGSFQALSMK